jgi:hypothetical protein
LNWEEILLEGSGGHVSYSILNPAVPTTSPSQIAKKGQHEVDPKRRHFNFFKRKKIEMSF